MSFYRFGQQGVVQPIDAAWQIKADSKLARHILFQAVQAYERHGDKWEDHFAKGGYGEPMILLLAAAEQLSDWLLELIRVVEQEQQEQREQDDARRLTEIRHTITSAAR
jgi:hypothetical protein